METYDGPEGLLRVWEERRKAFGAPTLETAEVIDARKGELVQIARFAGTTHDAAIEIEQMAGIVWTIRSGWAIHGRFFATKAEALEAAGLSE